MYSVTQFKGKGPWAVNYGLLYIIFIVLLSLQEGEGACKILSQGGKCLNYREFYYGDIYYFIKRDNIIYYYIIIYSIDEYNPLSI